MRPQLVIEYDLGEPPASTITPTPSSTATPTATPAAPADTSTPTPTATPLPPAATYTPTPTSTATPTPTATPGNAGQEVTLVIQRGTNGAVADSYIDAWAPDNKNGSYTKLCVRSGEYMQPVLRFDLSAVPANATVRQATLSLYVESRSTSTAALDMQAYRLIRPWSEAEVTWKQAQNGVLWSVAGANAAGADRDATPESAVNVSTLAAWVNLDVTAMVQSWVQNPDQNAGVLLKGIGSVGVQYYLLSSEFWSIPLRPKLTITYVTP
jgi:hypothetical protein